MLENLYKTSATKRGTRVSYHVLIIVCVLKYSIKSHLKETTLNNNNCGIYLEYYIWTGSRYTSIPGFVCLNIRKCLLSFGLFFCSAFMLSLPFTIYYHSNNHQLIKQERLSTFRLSRIIINRM